MMTLPPFELDREHAIPLYFQLKEHISEQLESGRWQPGDQIPSEQEFCRQYNISRMTVRQALGELVNEGLLRREKGRGTFVSRPKVGQHLSRLTSFSQNMQMRSMRPSAQVIRLEMIKAPFHVAKALRVEVGQMILLLRRLRLADGEPMAIETAHLHFPDAPRLLERENDLTKSLYALLTEFYGIVPTRAEERIEATMCSEWEMELLELEARSPVLLIRRITYDQHNTLFEYVKSVYRGDRYVFHAELTTL